MAERTISGLPDELPDSVGDGDAWLVADHVSAGKTKRARPSTALKVGGGLLADGSVPLTGPLDAGGQAVTNVGNVDGRDVSADGAALDSHVAAGNPHADSLSTSHEGAGGAVHADVVSGGASGFMSGADKAAHDAHIAATDNPHQTTTQQAVDQQGGAAVTVDASKPVRLDNDTDTTPVLGLGGTAAAPRIRTYDTFGAAAFEVDEDGNVPTALDITARRFSADDGSTASAAFRFSSENTGFYLNAAGQISFLIAGVQALWLNGTHLRPPGSALSLGDSTRKFQATYTGVLRVNDGISGAPAIRFDSEATGFFLPSPGVLRAQVDGGVDALTLDPSGGSTVHGDLTVTGKLAGDGGIELTEQSEPSTPAANQAALFAADDGGVSALRAKTDDGTVHELTGRAKKTTTDSDPSTAITLSDADDGKVIWCTASSTVTVTVPDTLSAGVTVELFQGSIGQVQLVAGGSAFLRYPATKNPYTAERWSAIRVTSVGSNQMLIRGDLETV